MTRDDDVYPTMPTSRRALVKGAAWAVPAVTVGVAAPAAAASLPPCMAEVSSVAQGSWSVGAKYGSCNQNTHFDVSVRVLVSPCDATSIQLRVYDLGDETGSGSSSRSRLWWSRIGQSGYLYIEKTVTVPAAGTTFPVSFAVQNDRVLRETTFLSSSQGAVVQGTIQACCSSENDGIHVNPCNFGAAGSVNKVAKLYYRLNATGAWQFGGYVNAARPR